MKFFLSIITVILLFTIGLYYNIILLGITGLIIFTISSCYKILEEPKETKRL